MHVKKGDNVKVLSGKDKGKTGSIILAMPKTDQVVVGGLNKIKKHVKATKAKGKGQTIEKEMPLHVSKVAKVK